MNDNFQLSKDQIDKLFDFTRKKYVKYEDVRFEIVDHLATDIENQMRTEESISFEGALKKVYNKFPVTGFAQMITAKENALKKIWRKKVLSIFLEYFQLPKIILTALIFPYFYWVQKQVSSMNYSSLWHFIMAFSPFVVLFVLIKLRGENLTNNKLQEKKFLFIKVLHSIIGKISIAATFIPIVILDPPESHRGLVLSSLLLSIGIILYVAILNGDFHRLITEAFNKEYSHLQQEFNLVNYA